MADCSYSRCIQERRYIKRELQKWTKDMVYIVGLERVAEELMGRRKWKLYQEVLARSHLNANATPLAPLTTSNAGSTDSGANCNNGHASLTSAPTNNHHSRHHDEKDDEALASDEKATAHPHKLADECAKENEAALASIKREPIDVSDVSHNRCDPSTAEDPTKLGTDHITETPVKSPQPLPPLQSSSTPPPPLIRTTEVIKVRDDLTGGIIGSATTADSTEATASEATATPAAVADELSPSTIKHQRSNHHQSKHHSQCPAAMAPQPLDWTPQDKCYFCVDGRLLTVNERGDLVPETNVLPRAEPDIVRRVLDESDSDSSDSSDIAEVRNSLAKSASVTSLLQKSLQKPQSMTSFESMAAQFATIASLNGFPQMYPGMLYNQLVQMNSNPAATADTTAAAQSLVNAAQPKESPNTAEGTGEQPLDLSSKPIGAFGHDSKMQYRSKSRPSTISGRRTYTEDELQNALQDILSGKLGTRRAAVLYGIPRSTLRNKVYKLALEQKREQNVHSVTHVLDDDDDDKELSGAEDDKVIEKAFRNSVMMARHHQQQQKHHHQDAHQRLPIAGSSASPQQKFAGMFESQGPPATMEVNDKSKSVIVSHVSATSTHSQVPVTPPSNPTAASTNPWLDPMMLQNILLSGMLQSNDPNALQEFLQNMLLQQELINEHMKKNTVSSSAMAASTSEHSNNGKVSDGRSQAHASGHSMLHQNKNPMHPLHLAQAAAQHQQHHNLHSRLVKTETPDTVCSADMNTDASDDAVILKIPSFKPVAGSSSSCKNGDSLSDTTPHTTPPMHSRSPLNHLSAGHSPPINRSSTESQSPPMGSMPNKSIFSLSDVIANSITKRFSQQQRSPEPHHLSNSGGHHHNASAMDHRHMEQHQPYKPTISVIKNLGGTDITGFASSPNMMHMGSNNSNSSHHSGGSGGMNSSVAKGTRPKRGKYRNYDRDSLIEAVKAVQRGEMSVHRAGSYYGVPHSTLEYKVKERHLMRPRKREPKPQPMDGTSPGPSSSMGGSHKSDMSGMHPGSSHRGMDKSKTLSSSVKTPQKTPPSFPDSSPNGLKMNMFDPTQMQFVPNMFWSPQPNTFSGLPMDFTLNLNASSGGGASNAYPLNAESLLTSQIMQRWPANDEMRHAAAGGAGGSGGGGMSLANRGDASKSSGRDMADSFYEANSVNGSFLDGIIRDSLGRKSGDSSHGALLDHLVKKTSRHHDGDLSGGHKRSASPTDYASPGAIKRERTSPPSSSDSDTDSMADHRDNMSKETYRAAAYAALQQQQQQQRRIDAGSGNGNAGCLSGSIENLNGGSPGGRRRSVGGGGGIEDDSS